MGQHWKRLGDQAGLWEPVGRSSAPMRSRDGCVQTGVQLLNGLESVEKSPVVKNKTSLL